MSHPDISIHSERLVITTFQPRHLCQAYVDWLNDKQLMQYSEQRHRQHTLQSCREYMQGFVNSDNFFFAIENKSGNMIGTMTVYQDTRNGLADIGILIGAQQAQGKGYGSEAWQAVMQWAIDTLKPRKLTAGCMASNTAMLNIMKNSGMQPDGIRKKHFLRNDKAEDIVYMARFVPDEHSHQANRHN